MAELLPTRQEQRKKTASLSPRVQSYAAQSLPELTEKLARCSKEEKSHQLSSRTRDIVYALKVHKLRHSSNAHAFVEAGGVGSLLSLLSLCGGREGRDRGLLLATLANLCALHKDCRSKVMNHGLTQVATVLSHCQTPATLCTLARLLGNLALDTNNIPRLQEVGVVRELSHALFFQSATDPASKLSVLRALRLLSASVSCRDELKSSEGLTGVVDTLRSEEEEVAKSALRTLHVLVEDSDPEVIQALVANKGLSPVIQLCRHGDQEVRDRAVEVLVACAGVSEGRAGLHSVGGVECLLGQLERVGPEEKLFPAVVTALSANCRDVVGRQRMRDCGGLETLIQLVSTPNHTPLHPDILSALVCYYFDENSLKFMVRRLGLLKALTYHLQRMASSSNTETEGEGTGSTGSSPCGAEVSPAVTGFDSATPEDTSSPFSPPLPPPPSSSGEDGSTSSSVSPQCSSPSSSPSLSDTQPPTKKPRLSCDLEFPQPTPANFLDTLLCSPSPYQTPPRRPATPDPAPSSSLESHVVQLLSRVSHMRDCLPHLASRDLLQAMLDCLLSSPFSLNTHIFKTLSRVFASPHCFQVAVTCLIPSRLHHHCSNSRSLSPPSIPTDTLDLSSPVPSLPSPHHLSPSPTTPSAPPGLGQMCGELLSRLSKVGQSPYGQGVLAHLLLTGEERERTASALAAPLLCRAPRVCRRLMVDYRGQDMLLQLLTSPSSPSPSLRDAAADSILALGSSPADLRPSQDHIPLQTNSGIPRQPRCRYRDYDHTPFDYMVKLDRHGTGTSGNGSETEQVELPTHREVLSEASEVFAVMLGGHFLESASSEVYLKGVQPQSFLSLLHHVYGCGWQCREGHMTSELGSHDTSHDQDDASATLVTAITSTFELQPAAEVLHTLRCLATASRFLLDSMRQSCERHASLFITTATVVPMFLFSRLHGCVWLSEECMRTLLSLPHSREPLLQLATSFEGPAAINILQNLLSTRLHTTP